jgi:hypothetical protein
MIYYGCSNCGGPLASPESLAGKTDVCPACKTAVQVPTASAVPAPVAKPIKPCAAESLCGFFAVLIILVATVLAFIYASYGRSGDTSLQIPITAFGALVGAAIALPYLAAVSVLRYLRTLVNAAGGKRIV